MDASTEKILRIMRDIEADDPLDYADLPVDPDRLCLGVVEFLVEHHRAAETAMSASDMHAMYMVSTARLALENLLLRARLLMLQQQPIDEMSLLARFTSQTKQ